MLDREKYIPVLDALLPVVDLEVVSVKRIRLAVQALFQEDLTAEKAEFKALFWERFDEFENSRVNLKKNSVKKQDEGEIFIPQGTPEGSLEETPERDSSEQTGLNSSNKRSLSNERLQDDSRDELSARELKKVKLAEKKEREARKKAKKKDTNTKGDGTKKKTGWNSEYPVSSQLSEVIGRTVSSRPAIVKSLWQYIKSNDLQNPENRRQILCDDKLKSVFNTSKVDMCTMNKLIGKHILQNE